MSSSNCCFPTCIQVSQEAGQVVWYSHIFQNFPQFIVIHRVIGFGTVNKAEIDVFLRRFYYHSRMWTSLTWSCSRQFSCTSQSWFQSSPLLPLWQPGALLEDLSIASWPPPYIYWLVPLLGAPNPHWPLLVNLWSPMTFTLMSECQFLQHDVQYQQVSWIPKYYINPTSQLRKTKGQPSKAKWVSDVLPVDSG